MKSAVQRAKLGREEELGALKRLDGQARVLERYVAGPSVEELIADAGLRIVIMGGRLISTGLVRVSSNCMLGGGAITPED